MEYYLDIENGDDSNPGTQIEPFLNIEKVDKVIKPRDYINVKLSYVIFKTLLVGGN